MNKGLVCSWVYGRYINTRTASYHQNGVYDRSRRCVSPPQKVRLFWKRRMPYLSRAYRINLIIPSNCLLERSVVSCAPPQRFAIIRFRSAAGSTAMLLILARLLLRAPTGKHRHNARITVSRKKEKRRPRRERRMWCCELRIEVQDGREKDVAVWIPVG